VTRTEELEEAMADSIGSDKLTLVEVAAQNGYS
jgi:indolepyruvate decarboxylase